jgi:hypothetical protein
MFSSTEKCPMHTQVGIVPDIEDFRYNKTTALTSSSKATPALGKNS